MTQQETTGNAPHTRLRTRLMIAFLIGAMPAALVSISATAILDRLIRDEIRRRTEEVTGAIRLMLDDEAERTKAAVSRFSDSEDLMHQILEPLQSGVLPENAQDLVDEWAKISGLDLLALVTVENDGGAKTLASAHLPISAKDPAPRFAKPRDGSSPVAGFVHELVAGNPPLAAPALVALRTIHAEGGRSTLLVYGGARLDTHRLEAIARTSHARLVIDSPGLVRLAFPGRAPLEDSDLISPHDLRADERGRALELDHLPDGRELVDTDVARDPNRPTRIEVEVDTQRLEEARAIFAASAVALAAFGLLLALVLGAWLSRKITEPILELSRAAERVGAGDLEIRITSRSRDEVGLLVQVFNQMTREISAARERIQRAERVAAWREIARRVAHEIKNPLFPIQMSMETLRKSFKTKHPALDEIFEESTKTVLDEVRALNRIVTEFSDFARLPAPRLLPADPLEVLHHVFGLYAHDRSSDAATSRVQLGEGTLRRRGLPEILIDREQIARALINLVKNAVEALPESGGKVTMDAREQMHSDRKGVQITIHDDGRGMTEEVRAKIFTPYFTTKPEGTGLGLAIVERIVQEHNGAIEITSAPGEGTTVAIWLPARPPVSPESGAGPTGDP